LICSSLQSLLHQKVALNRMSLFFYLAYAKNYLGELADGSDNKWWTRETHRAVSVRYK